MLWSGKIPEKYLLILTDTSNQPILEVLCRYFLVKVKLMGLKITFPASGRHDQAALQNQNQFNQLKLFSSLTHIQDNVRQL